MLFRSLATYLLHFLLRHHSLRFCWEIYPRFLPWPHPETNHLPMRQAGSNCRTRFTRLLNICWVGESFILCCTGGRSPLFQPTPFPPLLFTTPGQRSWPLSIPHRPSSHSVLYATAVSTLYVRGIQARIQNARRAGIRTRLVHERGT